MQQQVYDLFPSIYYLYNQIFIPLVKYVLLPQEANYKYLAEANIKE